MNSKQTKLIASSQLTRRGFVELCGGMVGIALPLALAGCAGGSSASSNDSGSASSNGSSNSSNSSDSSSSSTSGTGTITEPLDNGYGSGTHHATMVVRDYGTIQLELDADSAPITVSNFAQLVSDGFYDGLTFHRIIKGFMVQGGDPNGDGTGGSSRTIKGEFASNGVPNAILHKRGVISMARSSKANSASSQFFIMQEDNDSLNGQYAAFGHVTSGIEVVDAMAEVAVEDSNGTVAKENQPVIDSITMDD